MSEQDIKNSVQKGTTTIGIVCKEGIVLAADKRASAGYRIANKKMDKVALVSDNMAITMAGLVSDAQLITKLARAEIRLKELRTHKQLKVKEVANMMGSILYANIRRMSMVPGIVSFLLGGKDSTGFGLYELGVDGSVSSIDDFVSVGSGSDLALGVLEGLFKEGLTLKEGVELAKKAINSAVQRDMPTGDGIDIFVIDAQGARKVFHKKIEYSI